MASNQGNSKENYSVLLSTGAQAESLYYYDEDKVVTSTAERMQKRTLVQPVQLVIRGLTRSHAALLYSALDRHLNPLTFQEDDIVPLLKMDEDDVASIEREAIDVRTAPDSDFDILLGESEPGARRFDLSIRQGIQSEEEPWIFNRHINEGFMAVMSVVNLSSARAELEKQIKPRRPVEEGQNVALQYRRFSYKYRLEQPIKRHHRRGETQQFRDDMQEIGMLMGIFGISEALKSPPDELIDLWKKRGRNHIEMVNLYMYIVGRKQELRDSSSAHFTNSVSDFQNYSPKFTRFELQNTLTQRSRVVMGKQLRLHDRQIDRLYQLAGPEVGVAKLNYLAWVAGHPEMAKTAREFQDVLKGQVHGDYDMIEKMQALYKIASDELWVNAISLQGKKDRDDWWSDYGTIDYDLEIPDERDAYNAKLTFLRSAWMLGAFLFTKEKIDTFVRKKLQ